ncbi:MAG: heme-binding domain-containing protein [Nitrolancea sp.]
MVVKLAKFGLILIAIFALIQFIPYGRSHTNPAAVAEPVWDSPSTRDLASSACFDCHSNETKWPWYTSVAPVSWLTQHDVDEGRATLNFSDWNGVTGHGDDDPAEAVQSGEMPPSYYVMMHSHANLTAAEKDALVTGLQKTFSGTAGSGD